MFLRINGQEYLLKFGQSSRRLPMSEEKKMSLVMAFRLSTGDTLFVADKSNVEQDQAGNSGGRTEDAVKLIKYSDGVIGYAGYATLAKDIISGLSPLTSNDTVKELQDKILEQYNRLTAYMPTETRQKRAVEFLFANGNGIIHAYKSAENFSPELYEHWGSIGITAIATLTHYMFWHEQILLDIEYTKRIAALQIAMTSDADPTAVSQSMDMWLLRHGSKEPEEQDPAGINALHKHIDAFREHAVKALYFSKAPIPSAP